ncbi:MAG: phosphoglucosamine mutase [bacterium]
MKYFGTDGIRDKAKTLLSKNIGYYVGLSFARFKKDNNNIFIAMDTRESGEEIAQQIIKGLTEVGFDVYNIGVYPTPVLAFLTEYKNTQGVMITASHNPYIDNGIKIFDSGKKLSNKTELLIEEVIDKEFSVKTTSSKGKVIEYKSVMKNYLSLYDNILEKTDLKICLDLANGAAVSTAKEIFLMITDDLHIISDKPNGKNINKNCGSTDLSKLKEFVKDHNCDLGIAFDGDADRLMVIDDLGEVCDGDFLIYLFASYYRAHKVLKNDIVALSKMCNIGIIKALNKKYIDVIQTKVGDKYISEALNEKNAILGGENSGHIINKSLFSTGDGVLNAVFLIKVLNYYKLPLSNLKKQVNYYPDKLVNLKNIDKTLVNHQLITDIVNQYRLQLGDEGKVLVRASGTEPLVRISVSAPTLRQINKIIKDIKTNLYKLNKKEG